MEGTGIFREREVKGMERKERKGNQRGGDLRGMESEGKGKGRRGK